MHYINRSLAVVTPKQPFVDWLNSTEPGNHFTPELCSRNKTAILLPDFDSDEQAQRYIHDNFPDILRHEIVMRLADQSLVPQNIDYRKFRTWFAIDITSDVYDMLEDEIEREDV